MKLLMDMMMVLNVRVTHVVAMVKLNLLLLLVILQLLMLLGATFR